MLEFRLLKADEIEARISQVTEKGVTLLLYKDARCDMNVLDETVGPLNWQRHHSRDNANCIVSIWDEDKKQWIEKEDTGTEANTEPEKSLASSSFKRACTNFGIGRELYTAPFCFFPANECVITAGKCYDKFEVVTIMYDANRRKITSVEIGNKKTGKIRTFTNGTPAAPKKPAEPEKKNYRQQILDECSAGGINPDWIAGKCGCNSFDDLSEESIIRCLKNWKQLVTIFEKEMNS